MLGWVWCPFNRLSSGRAEPAAVCWVGFGVRGPHHHRGGTRGQGLPDPSGKPALVLLALKGLSRESKSFSPYLPQCNPFVVLLCPTFLSIIFLIFCCPYVHLPFVPFSPCSFLFNLFYCPSDLIFFPFSL